MYRTNCFEEKDCLQQPLWENVSMSRLKSDSTLYYIRNVLETYTFKKPNYKIPKL